MSRDVRKLISRFHYKEIKNLKTCKSKENNVLYIGLKRKKQCENKYLFAL